MLLKRNALLLSLMLLLAALLAWSAPALAETHGKVNLECLSVQWQVEGDNVEVILFLQNQRVKRLLLTADNPIQQVNNSKGNCSVEGSFKLMAKSVWGQGTLSLDVTIKQGNNTYGHEGTLGTW